MLPYDYARCNRHIHETHSDMDKLTLVQAECVRCLRRTEPGNPNGWQTYMEPPKFVDGKCPKKLNHDTE